MGTSGPGECHRSHPNTTTRAPPGRPPPPRASAPRPPLDRYPSATSPGAAGTGQTRHARRPTEGRTRAPGRFTVQVDCLGPGPRARGVDGSERRPRVGSVRLVGALRGTDGEDPRRPEGGRVTLRVVPRYRGLPWRARPQKHKVIINQYPSGESLRYILYILPLSPAHATRCGH